MRDRTLPDRTLLWTGGILFSIAMAVAVLTTPLAKNYPEFTVELKVASHKNVEVFLDRGDGFQGDDKVLFSPQPDRFARFHAIIPYREVRGVRVDAGDRGNVLSIRSIEMISAGTHEKLHGKDLYSRIIKTSGLDELKVKDGILYCVVNNDDPYVVLMPKDLNAYPRVLWQQIALALTVSLLAGGAFAFTIFSPGSSILFFFSFTFLLILQKSFFFNNLNLYTLFSDPKLLPSINLGLWGATLLTWGFNLYKENAIFSRKAFYQLYHSVFIAMGILFSAFYLDPAYRILIPSCAVLIIAFYGGMLSIGFRQSIEGMVSQNHFVPVPAVRLCKISLFASIVFLIVGRAPSLLTDPRMWAEDGGHTVAALAGIHDWTAYFCYV